MKSSILCESYLEAGVGLILKLDDTLLNEIKNIVIPEAPGENIMTRIPSEKTHITLTSIKSFNQFKKDFENSQEFNTIAKPIVQFGKSTFVTRPDGRITYVVAIKNQSDLKNFVDDIYSSMGLQNPEPDRFFHITIANNQGGDSMKSIGNVEKSDFEKSDIISEVRRMKVLAGILRESQEDIQVWLDMDGVLANMQGKLNLNTEILVLREIVNEMIENNFQQYKDLSDDELKVQIKKDLELEPDNEDLRRLKKAFSNYNNKVFALAGRPNFFSSLEMMPGATELVKKSYEITGKKPNILSAPMGNENDENNISIKEKKGWILKNFAGMVNQIEFTVDKDKFARSRGDILIDDRTKYIKKFNDAGGTAILYKNADDAIKQLEEKYKELTS